MSDQVGYLLAFSLTASAMRIFFLWLKRQQLVSGLDCLRPAWSFHGFNLRIVKQQQLVWSLDSLSLEVPQLQLAAKGL
jgi:hypothetical protein